MMKQMVSWLYIRATFFSDVLDKLKVQSQNGKEMFPLSQVAEIKHNDSMFVIDLRDSPEVCQYLLSTFYILLICKSYW